MNTLTKRKIHKMLVLSKFQVKCMWPQYLVLLFTLLVQFTITMLVGRFAGESAGSLDFPMLAFATVLGILTFTIAYRYAVLSGLTRKMYFITAMLTVFVLSLCYALVTFTFMSITHATYPSNDLFTMVYGGGGTLNHGALILFLWGSALCMAMLGQFLTAVFYRTRMRGKLFILAGTIIGVAILTGIHFLSGGALGRGLLNALIHLFGFANEIPNPFLPTATLAGLSVILAAGSFLLLRRADLRN